MLPKTNILITGLPGCGKSTLINRLVEHARNKGIKVGGISTPEFRLPNGRRGGFLIRDIESGVEDTMASIKYPSPVRVARYGVNLTAISTIGVRAINQAIIHSDLVIIDEIGKMELYVSEFKRIIIEALKSPKPVVGTIGKNLKEPFILRLKNRNDIIILTLTTKNRSVIYQELTSRLNL